MSPGLLAFLDYTVLVSPFWSETIMEKAIGAVKMNGIQGDVNAQETPAGDAAGGVEIIDD
jgi:hypothetical protein